jgi:ribosome assembly protein RRB1
MLHVMSTTWPCLSFDIITDSLGNDRKAYPRTVYAVAGTQAETARPKDNELYVLKLSSLSKMDRGNQTDSESDDDSGDDDVSSDPILESKSIPLPSTTNRIRATQLGSTSPSAIPTTLTATWLESGEIAIHDVTPYLNALSTPGTTIPLTASKPLSTLRMHNTEGYALDWALPTHWPHGRLLTGDNNGTIFNTQRTESGGFSTDTRPFTGHTGSIEELQWSPSEKTVFASASSDGTVKVWDIRSKSRKPAVDVKVSNTDVNVMSWSRQTAHLLATGCDDGEWAVWDLRQWKPTAAGGGGGGGNKDTPQSQSSSQLRPTPVAKFNFHKKPITSIEWHPSDDSVVGVACADGTATLWDLAVELDDEEYGREAGLGLGEGQEKVPPQLLFIHSAEDVKELHWHSQMPGTVMCTGGGGFGVFKTISV